MLKHRTILALCILAFGILLLRAGEVPLWAFFIPVLVYLGFSVWGAVRINSDFFIPVLCKGNGQEKAVALSFDDGPVQDHTPKVLDVLREHRVPAAFFCIGHRAAEAPGLLKRIHEEGHLIGNHSCSHHFWFDLFSSGKMLQDMWQADEHIAAVTGQKPRLFRPPYGVTNPNLATAIRKGGYIPAGWSVRSLDTVIHESDQLLERVTRRVRPGDIFLFHDTSAATVKILPELIRHLQSNGFVIRRIDELLKVPAYA